MDVNKIKRSMTNIKPNQEQIKRIEEIRDIYKSIVDFLDIYCPDSMELSLSITSLETSLMWAVKSIVLEENDNEK